MKLYNIGAFLKIIIGVIVLSTLYHYINIYKNPAVGLSFGFLGAFMIVWGASYYLFLLSYKIFSKYPLHIQTSLSYKLSLLLGMYTIINLSLIITDNWTKFLGILLFLMFVAVQIIFATTKRQSI